MSTPAFPLLDLPSNVLLGVFARLPELADARALSSACRELWAAGAAARTRHVCCAGCGHALLQPAAALTSDTHREAPPLKLPDGASLAVEPQHCTGCRFSGEAPMEVIEALFCLRVGGLQALQACLALLAAWKPC